MKKSYIKLIFFEIILLALLIFNIFKENIINNYLIALILFALIIVFKKIFGIEKEQKRYTKELMIDISIVYILFFVVYYLFGLITGYYKTNNYFTFFGITTFIIPNIFVIGFKEYLRFLIYAKIDKNKFLNICSFFIFVMIDLVNVLKLSKITSIQGTFYLIALSIIPVLVNNIVANNVLKKSNYKVNIFWILILELHIYFLPFIPNVGDYILSIINIVLPLIIYKKVNIFFENIEDKDIERESEKKFIIPYITTAIIIFSLVYFSSGFFRFQTIAIASGSMNPYFSKGDVVLIDKKFDKIELEDVIAYKYKDVIVVHRVINKIEKDGVFYYTKGDANLVQDNYVVKQEDIVGVVEEIIPYAGLPAVWLNGL